MPAKFIHVTAFLAILGGGSLASPTLLNAQTASATVFSTIEHMGTLSSDNRNPVVAYSQDGNQLFVVWDGIIAGNRRIVLRERVNGQWLEPVAVDQNPAGSNELPNIAIDSTGAPHVAWISTVGGKRLPAYARRVSRASNAWHQQDISLPKDSTLAGACDYLNMKLDPDDKPWIVWQYGFGSIYSIAVSHVSEKGEMVSSELTPGASTHNLDPKIFFVPSPTVYWYVAQSDQFFLVGSRYNPDTSEWELAPPENFENLPADNLPEIFQTDRGPFAAIWYDQLDSFNTDLESEHVFLGFQDAISKGRGEAINQETGADTHSVSGASSPNSIVTTWVSETYDAGSHVYVGVGDSPSSIQQLQASDAQTHSNDNPSVAVSASEATVSWEEESPSGSAQIVTRTLKLRP